MRCPPSLMLSLALAGCEEPNNFGTQYIECHDLSFDDLPEECGTPCEAYCCALMENCGRILALTADECLEQCEEIPQDGMEGDARGDTLQCRMTYARRAEGDEAFCAYATPQSFAACN